MGLFGSIIGTATSILGGNAQKKAADKAADAQVKAAQLAIDEQRRQFDVTQDNFAPYLGAGTSALGQISSLLGISSPGSSTVDWEAYARANPDVLDYYTSHNGRDLFTKGDSMSLADYGKAHYDTYGSPQGRDLTPFTTTIGASDGLAGQAAAIDALKASPLYQSLYRNGEEAILSNAAATGGLRGGNTQSSLYNLGADTLSNVIQNQLANLGGIANMGMGSAGQLGQFGATAASNIGNSLTQQGQAQAGAALTKGGINASNWNNIGGALDSIGSAISGGGSLSSILGKIL